MNILISNHYAGAKKYGMEYRHYYLAQEWVRQGHTVTILAASYSHLRTRQPATEGRLTEEWLEGIRYLWYRTPPYSNNGLGRARNIGSYLRQFWWDARRLARKYRPDAVIASSTYPLDIYPAGRLARASGAKLVFEVHDLWPLSPVELGIISRWNPLAIASFIAEGYACRHAHRVISVLPKADRHLRERGMPADHFVWIPNGVNAAGWDAVDVLLPEEHRNALAALRGKFIVGYAGGHGVPNALDYLVEAAALLAAEPVAFVFVGHGSHKERLQATARHLGLTNTIFLPSVDRAVVPGLMKAMDALYIGWHRQPVYRFGISANKLFDYMMTERPIIHAVEAGNDPVADAACGLSCPPQDPTALAETIRRMMTLSPAEREAMGQRGKLYVKCHHDYAVLANRFLEVIR